ncbi:hypothetical protein [Streptomyces sp. bgisy100]|uniref:hypothetical protein n=1 Tax=Streptomyces sp. bgisy100 TaxID=3413783 RepID=UPI003D757BB5
MADMAGRTIGRSRGLKAVATIGVRRSGTRHPLVAAAMVLPLAMLLAVTFGGWEAVVTQASSMAGALGR